MTEKLRKVVVTLSPDDWHGFATESVWAEQVTENLFQIKNVPFYAKELSIDDVVLVEFRSGSYYLKFVSKRSGHSTYRIFLGENVSAVIFRKYWQPLEEIGCSYEKGQGRLIAIDVPDTTDVHKTYSLLEEGEKHGIWEFEEGHCGHPLSKNIQ